MADIFRAHGEAYRQTHRLTPQQLKVMRDIETCRTAVLGGHLDVCDRCGYKEPSYNSCRNRHCPKCQSLRQARWVRQRMTKVLPTPHFHVVFTLPHDLATLARGNPETVYTLLFAAASQTLLQLGHDPDRLGALLGITAVLHTWTRDLRYHPHLHCIVTGGGISPDQRRWVAGNPRYLFPVKVIATLFRGKILDGLAQAHAGGTLRLDGPCRPLRDKATFAHLIDRLYRKDWVVYAKRPFAGPRQVFAYLGRYTHRVAISNERLVSVDDDQVCFVTKNNKRARLAPRAFIGRFLMHVLPRGFVKIRHYGLLSPHNTNTRRRRAARLLCASLNRLPAPVAMVVLVALGVIDRCGTTNRQDPRRAPLHDRAPQPDPDRWHEPAIDTDLRRCPRCGTGRLVAQPLDTPTMHPPPPPPVWDSS